MSQIIYQHLEQQLSQVNEPILLLGHAEKNILLTPILHLPYLCVLFDLELLDDLLKIHAHSYQVIIFDKLLEEHDFLVLLDRARSLLAPKGTLYFIDTMLAEMPTERTPVSTSIMPYLVAQAQRLGFDCVDQQQHELTLLQLEQVRTTRWRVLPVTEQHQSEMQTLFKQVFGSEMSDAMWRWKYKQGVAVGVWQQEQMIAHYGGMQRRLQYFGEPRLGIQIGDVMVLPTERGRLTKHGAFFLSASTFSERHVGYGTAHFLPYGFPNQRHIRVAERLGIYAKVDDVVDITWDNAVVGRKSKWQYVQPIKQQHKLRKVVKCLWQKMQVDLQQHICLTRDWEYINYRYLQRPDKTYTFLTVYDILQRPVGLVIIAIEPDYCRFMDYIGCISQLTRVMHQVCAYLHQQQITQLGGWFSGAIAEKFAQTGGQVSRTEIILPTIIWGQGVNVERIKQRWWLTTGDADFL